MLSFSRASSTTSPADALRGFGPLGVREGAGDVAAGRIERSARPLPVAGAGLDQAAQRLVCGAAPRAVLNGHLIARQADRAVDVADRTGPASSRTPYPAAEQAGPQVLRAPVAAALSSPPPDPLPGLTAALRGLTHEAARFPQLHSASSSSMIRYQTDDEGVVSQPEYTLTKPSNGPNDRDHLTGRDRVRPRRPRCRTMFSRWRSCVSPPSPSGTSGCTHRPCGRRRRRARPSRRGRASVPAGAPPSDSTARTGLIWSPESSRRIWEASGSSPPDNACQGGWLLASGSRKGGSFRHGLADGNRRLDGSVRSLRRNGRISPAARLGQADG